MVFCSILTKKIKKGDISSALTSGTGGPTSGATRNAPRAYAGRVLAIFRFEITSFDVRIAQRKTHIYFIFICNIQIFFDIDSVFFNLFAKKLKKREIVIIQNYNFKFSSH
jgi:hypothetical protein